MPNPSLIALDPDQHLDCCNRLCSNEAAAKYQTVNYQQAPVEFPFCNTCLEALDMVKQELHRPQEEAQ